MRFPMLQTAVAALLLSGMSPAISQEVTTFIIKGRVTQVDDPNGLLDNTIQVGDTLKGRIKFDHDAGDENADETVGDYRYHNVPGGMWVKIKRYVFKATPGYRDFLVELVNRTPEEKGDALAFNSYLNVFPMGLEQTRISWLLDDPTGAALTDVILPTNINLAAWQQNVGLTIEGNNGSPRSGGETLFIRATIFKVLLPKAAGATLKDDSDAHGATEAIPLEYSLQQNFPNPFNPSTTIGYALPEESFVSLRIYDLLGKEVRTLVDDFESAGMKSVRWDGTDNLGREVAAGLYIYRLEAENFVQAKKLAFVK